MDDNAVAANSTVLPVNFVPQGSYQELCWAACGAMLTDAIVRCYPNDYPNMPSSLCGVVSAIRNTQCCPVVPPNYDKPQYPDDVISALFGTSQARRWDGQFEWDDVRQEISIGLRPIEMLIGWDGDAGDHVALIVGINQDTQQVLVMDPLNAAAAWLDLAAIKKGYSNDAGSGQWIGTYYGLGVSLKIGADG